ncbi:DsrE family protein [Methyloprofundus sp.]|uniref:DsrE family protein n=1 Tax=Methyloprofundus sp. TaxID=2020875 RepID=UPI003D1503F5
MTTTTEKYLINCQEGANHMERATISFILAVTASKTSEAAVFITSDASQLCLKGGADGLTSEGLEPIADLIQQFVQNGGKIWLCPVCAKVKGITQDDLITGVEIAGAPKTMAFLASGAKVLA